MEELKSLKEYCREAKKRLKQGFWKDYKKGLQDELDKANQTGLSASKIKEYYNARVESDIKPRSLKDEDFYLKVKNLLDTEGEVSDALGRLTDKEYFNTLSYDEKQRYTLNLSERYVKAVERYNREKQMDLSV